MKYQFLGLLFIIIFTVTACTHSKDLEIQSGKDILFYPENNIPEVVARRLLEFLKSDGYLDNSGMQVRVEQNVDTYYVQLVADTFALTDTAYMDLCRDYTATLCREVFAGKTTDIWLCNADFMPFKKVNCILPPEQRRALSRIDVQGNILYFSASVEHSDVLQLAGFLSRDSFFTENNGVVAELDKLGTQWIFKFVATSESLESPSYKSVIQDYAIVLSDSVFSGASVSIHLCDRNLSSIYASGN